MQYLPFEKRKPDFQYQNILKNILKNGIISPTRQGPNAITLIGQQMHFDLKNGFPMITERDIHGFWRKPIDELCAFVNGVRTRDGLKEYGVTWWDGWTSAEKCQKRGLEVGDIGPGSYGAAFHDFPTAEGGSFDQFQHIVEQIKELPGLRTHFVTPWIPQYIVRGKGKQQKVTLAPCHGWIHIRVIDEGLYLHMFQRSGDMPIGVPSNMIQYAALLLMLEQLTGFTAKQYVHTISDAHIYEDQIEHVNEVVKRMPRPFPAVSLNDEGKKITDIHDFRGHHFELKDYDPHSPIKGIPVAT